MIETYFRRSYQKICIDPLLRVSFIQKASPNFFTALACFLGISIAPLLSLKFAFLAFVMLMISGFLDTLDGSLAREQGSSSPVGAGLDIVSDRVVEFAVILGLYLVDPKLRALPCIIMLGSILVCVTSFLIVGLFSEKSSEKSFFYSPGLMERAEAFIAFATMMLLPSSFAVLSYLFSFLVFFTAALRMGQFFCSFKPLKEE